MDQFISDIKHKCVEHCKSNNTNVSKQNNTIVFMSTLASRLKEARKDKKLSQEALSKLLGADHGSFVGNVESGRNKSFSKIVQAAEVLGVNALWLAEGKGPKSAKSLKTVMDAIAETSARDGLELGVADKFSPDAAAFSGVISGATAHSAAPKSVPQVVGGYRVRPAEIESIHASINALSDKGALNKEAIAALTALLQLLEAKNN